MAAKKSDAPDPSAPGRSYSEMAPKWAMINALLGGTDAMRAAGRAYLPQYENESDRRYATRLNMATLLNLTAFTLANLVGRVFKNPMVLNDDVPEAIRGTTPDPETGLQSDPGLAEDIDGQGNHLHVFCYNWFERGVAKGLGHVLIEMPVAAAPEPGRVRTKADDAGLRPYWVHVAAENVIFMSSAFVGGKEVLQQVRILEEYTEPSGMFEESCGTQVRVLRPGLWEVWRYTEDRRGNRSWYVADAGETQLDYIPLVTFYARRTGLGVSKVPLEDLAQLNVEHWQSKSDQRSILTAARFPILAVAGSDGEDETTGRKVSLGPYSLLSTTDPTGRYYYVEHTGAAINAGRTDLRDLEDQMASYGAQFLKKKADMESATGRILDSSETLSDLQAFALNFKDSVEQALKITAECLGLDGGGGSVTIDAGLSLSLDGSDLQTLNAARANRDLSRRQYLEELKRRDVLADDFDEQLNEQELAEENDLGVMAGDPLAGPAPANPKPAAPPVKTGG